MPRPRPPHLHREKTRHGKAIWYVRIDRGPRIRLRAEFGSPEFDAEYQAALAGQTRARKGAPAAGTLAWLVARYRETSAWTTLSAATRKQRENIFTHVLQTAGTAPIGMITKATIVAGRERRATTPDQARHFLDSLRGLFRWALQAGLVKVDPTAGVENPRRNTGDGFRPWTEDDVDVYQRHWPLGTRQRVWLDVLLYSGLRRGDAVRFGRQHVRNGIGKIKTEKSNYKIEVTLPILSILQHTFDVGPCGELTFICGENRKPLTKESFGNLFRKACAAAGVPGSAHGVRKIAATTAANNGATEAELEALFGWRGGKMAALYTRAADRERLSRQAINKLENDARTSIPAPKGKVGEPERKD